MTDLNKKNILLFFGLCCRFHFKGIIDYIFYSKQSMTPLGLLGPLAADWLKDNKVIGCPHPHIPSGNDISNSNCSLTVNHEEITSRAG